MLRQEQETKRHPTLDSTCIEVLSSAEKLASDLGVTEIGPQYIFVCLLQNNDLQTFLTAHGFECQSVINTFMPNEQDKERQHPKKVRYSPKASVIVNHALEQATLQGQDKVTPKNLLAATLRIQDRRILVLFRNQKVTPQELSAVLQS